MTHYATLTFSLRQGCFGSIINRMLNLGLSWLLTAKLRTSMSEFLRLMNSIKSSFFYTSDDFDFV